MKAEIKDKKKGCKKKGFIDIIFLGILIFVIVVVVIVAGMLQTNLKEKMTPTLNNAGSTLALDKGERTLFNFDLGIIVIYISMLVYLIISSFYLASHPIFFWVGLIVMFIAVFLSGVFTNAYEQLTIDGEMNRTANNYPITTYFMQHLPLFIAIGCAVVIIIFVAKPWQYQGGGGGGGL